MSMKNDVSFLINNEMNLYEHQSIWNSNMPLRGLFYFSRLYQGYVSARQLDIYSSAQLRLLVSRYIVFYNGPEGVPEKTILRLSTSFEGADKAITDCLGEGVLVEYLTKHRAEVTMSIVPFMTRPCHLLRISTGKRFFRY